MDPEILRALLLYVLPGLCALATSCMLLLYRVLYGRINAAEARMNKMQSELESKADADKQRSKIENELHEFRGETRSTLEAIRSEASQDLASFRTEIGSRLETVRTETNARLDSLNAQLTTVIQALAARRGR